jgi:tetratricopeptide (TPR) repeat protein
MDRLLGGLVPGLPEELRRRIAAQAEGVPLYAVETVRMLLDRGDVVPGEDGYELVGTVDELDVPETLQTLVAARLGGLDREVRDLVQDAAVLGQSFTRDGLTALSGLDAAVIDERLRTLRAKDLVGVDAGARGPEGGRYTFLQAIVRTVAYDTLSRHERQRRHLAAARHLESLPARDELGEGSATNSLDAYRVDPDAADAAAIREDALQALRRAADRAESLAAVDEAARCWARVVELTDVATERADALLRGGELSRRAGRTDEATAQLREAADLFAGLGDTRQEALAEATIARIDFDEGRGPEAVERLETAVARLDADANPSEYARLSNELARQLFFLGRIDDAGVRVDEALVPAERERLVDVVCDALNTKALVLWNRGRPEEAIALMRHANDLSVEVPSYIAQRAANNLVVLLSFRGWWDEAREVAERAHRRLRREGDASGVVVMLDRLGDIAVHTGRWDEAAAHLEAAEEFEVTSRLARRFTATSRISLLLRQGELESAREAIDAYAADGLADEQERLLLTLARMRLHHHLGSTARRSRPRSR